MFHTFVVGDINRHRARSFYSTHTNLYHHDVTTIITCLIVHKPIKKLNCSLFLLCPPKAAWKTVCDKKGKTVYLLTTYKLKFFLLLLGTVATSFVDFSSCLNKISPLLTVGTLKFKHTPFDR